MILYGNKISENIWKIILGKLNVLVDVDKSSLFIPSPAPAISTTPCPVSNENYLMEDKLCCVYIIMTLPSSTKLLTADIPAQVYKYFLKL